MSSGVTWDVQKALYELLTDNITLTSMISGVYDYVPEGSDYPYIVFSQSKTQDISNISQDIYQVDYDLTVYSRERGSKNLFDIVEKMDALLDGKNLMISGYNPLPIRVLDVNHNRQVDGLTYKATISVRIVLQKTV